MPLQLPLRRARWNVPAAPLRTSLKRLESRAPPSDRGHLCRFSSRYEERVGMFRKAPATQWSDQRRRVVLLRELAHIEETHAKTLAEAEGQQIGPEYQQLFDAARRGDVS